MITKAGSWEAVERGGITLTVSAGPYYGRAWIYLLGDGKLHMSWEIEFMRIMPKDVAIFEFLIKVALKGSKEGTDLQVLKEEARLTLHEQLKYALDRCVAMEKAATLAGLDYDGEHKAAAKKGQKRAT